MKSAPKIKPQPGQPRQRSPRPEHQPGERDIAERKPREERWEDLLTAAAKIFYEKGYDASSLQDIATEVGILKGSIYYYIRSKKDLRDHLVHEVHSNGIKLITAAAQAEGNALERLEGIVFAHITYLCDHMAQATVYLQEVKNVIEDSKLDIKQHAYRDIVEGVVRDGIKSGYLLSDLDPAFTAQIMLSSLNSISDWYRPRPAWPPHKIAKHLARTLTHGHASAKGLNFLKRRATESDGA